MTSCEGPEWLQVNTMSQLNPYMKLKRQFKGMQKVALKAQTLVDDIASVRIGRFALPQAAACMAMTCKTCSNSSSSSCRSSRH